MKKIIYTALVAVFTLSSCQKNDELPQGNSNFPADGVIRIETGVATRAGVETANLTEFGLCVTNSANTNYSYDNIQMTKTTSWSSAQMMLWQNATQTVDFVAYAPYQSTVAYTTTTNDAVASVLENQVTADYVKASDFIAERKTDFNPSSELSAEGKVKVAMNHLMSKLNLSITLGTELNNGGGTATNPISALTINGTKIEGQCNFTATPLAVVSKSDATAKPITPLAGTYTKGEAETKRAVANYECILVPQSVAVGDFSVSFTIGDKAYTWTSTSAVTLASGKEYELNLTAGKDIVTAGSMSAREWTEGTGGNIATE